MNLKKRMAPLKTGISIFFLLTLHAQTIFASNPSSAITYAPRGLRLGDKLLLYVKAKWLSYKYDIPLLHKPFTYSDQFVLHHHEQHFRDKNKKSYQNVVTLKNDLETVIEKNSGILYQVNHHYETQKWENCYEVSSFKGLIDDPTFMTELKKMIRPVKQLPKPNLPPDRISIAVHVRKGGGHDLPLKSPQLLSEPSNTERTPRKNTKYADVVYPLKFPPDQYYIDQIICLSKMLGDAPLHVHIFTDDPNPQKILDRFKHAINKDNISYACREKGNRHNAHVLEDLFAMAEFDCLIRSGSHLAQIAQLIGDHTIVIYPKEAHWIESRLVIDDIGIVAKDGTRKFKTFHEITALPFMSRGRKKSILCGEPP